MHGEDFSPLQQISPQLTIYLDWQPGQLEQLAVLPINADISPLAKLTGLENLDLSFDGESAVDLTPLGALTNLRLLTLDGLNVPPAETLPDMPSLEELNLYYYKIELAHTPALKRLYLNRIIPDDLTPLYTLPALNYLQINAAHTDVFGYVERLEALHEAMPNLTIVLYYCC